MIVNHLPKLCRCHKYHSLIDSHNHKIVKSVRVRVLCVCVSACDKVVLFCLVTVCVCVCVCWRNVFDHSQVWSHKWNQNQQRTFTQNATTNPKISLRNINYINYSRKATDWPANMIGLIGECSFRAKSRRRRELFEAETDKKNMRRRRIQQTTSSHSMPETIISKWWPFSTCFLSRYVGE